MWRKYYHYIQHLIAPIIACVIIGIAVDAPTNIKATTFQIKKSGTTTATTDDIKGYTFDENLNKPSVGKQHSKIKRFQESMRQSLISQGCDVDTIRSGEVLKVSIPSELLFTATDTTLTAGASRYLSPILPLLRIPDFYHVLLAYHTDNTGAESYKMAITQKRVNVVYNWYAHTLSGTDNVAAYAFGDMRPITDNTIAQNRRANRRLEIFIVPGNKMIEQAKKNSLNSITIF